MSMKNSEQHYKTVYKFNLDNYPEDIKREVVNSLIRVNREVLWITRNVLIDHFMEMHCESKY